MKAIVLAAGLGTRLRPLTHEVAKPALPVCGVPGLWYNSWYIKKSLNIEEIAINVSYKAQSVINAIGDSELCDFTGIKFYVSDESSEILGSSGALWKLKGWIGNAPAIITNGDNICVIEWQKMLTFHIENKSDITLHLRPFDLSGNTNSEPYSNIDVDASGVITGLRKKSNKGIMFSGNYIINPEVLDLLPKGVSELVPAIINPKIKEKKCFGYIENSSWLDLGTVESYYRSQLEIAKNPGVFKELLETKMKLTQGQSWCTKGLNMQSVKLNGTNIIDCSQAELENLPKKIGPNVVLINPLIKFKEHPNCLIFKDYFHQF